MNKLIKIILTLLFVFILYGGASALGALDTARGVYAAYQGAPGGSFWTNGETYAVIFQAGGNYAMTAFSALGRPLDGPPFDCSAHVCSPFTVKAITDLLKASGYKSVLPAELPATLTAVLDNIPSILMNWGVPFMPTFLFMPVIFIEESPINPEVISYGPASK